mmetsp:Transcript_136890/g.237874  ORF Transcript_136890/g.237874 Transcript_136890/m.237874 type:complete len:203 (-) Transcript_136890:163-771(-)
MQAVGGEAAGERAIVVRLNLVHEDVIVPMHFVHVKGVVVAHCHEKTTIGGHIAVVDLRVHWDVGDGHHGGQAVDPDLLLVETHHQAQVVLAVLPHDAGVVDGGAALPAEQHPPGAQAADGHGGVGADGADVPVAHGYGSGVVVQLQDVSVLAGPRIMAVDGGVVGVVHLIWIVRAADQVLQLPVVERCPLPVLLPAEDEVGR